VTPMFSAIKAMDIKSMGLQAQKTAPVGGVGGI